MKKIMGHVTGKLSLSILTAIILLVGVLAGSSRITSTKSAKTGSKISAANDSRSPEPARASEQASTSGKAVNQAAKAVKPAAASEKASAKAQSDKAHKDVADVQTAMNKMPLVFEPNVGQSDATVQYFARSSGYSVYLTGPASATFAYRKDEKEMDVVSMKLAGANAMSQGRAEEPTGGVSNYYIGNDRSKWHSGIPHFLKVRYPEVYSGVDVVYQGSDRKLRYDFEVKPGADPKAIRFSYDKAKKLTIDQRGSLVVDVAGAKFAGSKPYIFQEYGGKKHVVEGNYVLTAENEVGFQIGSYDPAYALVIDPDLVTYGTYDGSSIFLGGGGAGSNTQVTGTAIDVTGVYFAGWTNSNALPATTGAQQATIAGGKDAFIGKLPTSLQAASTVAFTAYPIYLTYLGGAGDDVATGLAVSGGNPVVVGWTQSSTGFPTLHPIAEPGAAITPITHAWVATLNGATAGAVTAGSLFWSTTIYGGGFDYADGVAVETTPNAGRIHVAMSTTSSDFFTATPVARLAPTGNLPFQNVQNSATGSTNVLYLAFAPPTATGSSVVYGTYEGGYGTDTAGGPSGTAAANPLFPAAVGNPIAVDSLGNAYIVGTSTSWGAGQIVNVPTAGTTGGTACSANLSASFTPPPSGTTATGNPLIYGGVVVAIVITNPGSGYTPGGGPGPAGSWPIVFGASAGGCGTPPTGWNGVTMTSALTAGSTTNFPRSGSSANFFINPLGTVAPLAHGFIAKFNPNTASAPSSSAPAGTNNNTLSYSVPLGGVGCNTQYTANNTTAGALGPLPQAASTCTFTETDTATSVAVDQFGNAYASGTAAGTIGANTITQDSNAVAPGPFLGVNPNTVFTAPVGAGGVGGSSGSSGAGMFSGLTLTRAGIGYTPSVAGGALSFTASDCQIIPKGVASTNAAGEVTSVVLTNHGGGCKSATAPTFPTGTFGTPVTAASVTATMASLVEGSPTGGTPNVDGFVVELLSNASIGGGPTSTTTQDGIQLGTVPPALPSTAGFPSLVYATLVTGDDLNTAASTGTFGASSSIPPAITSMSGIAVDALGQAYVAGSISSTNTSSAPPQAVIVRRRVNSRGTTLCGAAGGTVIPNNTGTPGTICAVAPPAPTAQFSPFLQNFPSGTQSVTKFGDILLGPGGGVSTGAGNAVAFDPTSNTSCFGGFVGQILPDTTIVAPLAAPTPPYQSVYTGVQDGLLGCAPYSNDAVVTTTAGNGTVSFGTMQAGVQSTKPDTSSNICGVAGALAAPNCFPASQTITVTSGTPVTINTDTVLYSPGTAGGTAGPLAGASAAALPWLAPFTISGNTLTLSLSANASKLDPGSYGATFNVIPTCACDNSGVPQPVSVSLTVTSTLLINTAQGGGVPAGTGTTIPVTLSSGGVFSGPGTVDSVTGNLVINIPVIANVPLNSPSLSNVTFLLNEGTNGSPRPSNTNATFPVLNNVPAGTVAGAGAVFLAPATGPEAAFLPPGATACGSAALAASEPGGNFVGATQGAGGTLRSTKSAADSAVCYFQVILPSTLLAGAPAGVYSGTLQIQVAAQSGSQSPATDFSGTLTGTPSGAALSGNVTVTNASITISVTLGSSGLTILSPWVSSGAASPGNGSGVYTTTIGSPIRPLAPFTVNSGYTGTVTSALGSGFPCGNLPPASPFDCSQTYLGTASLGTTTTGSYTASAAGGLQPLMGTYNASAQQVQNDYTINLAATIANTPAAIMLPGAPNIATCTTSSPAIPPGVLLFPASGTLPASNAAVNITAFPISIQNPSGLANGFYASTITVIPNGNPALQAMIAVCLTVGNNVMPVFEQIPGAAPVPISGAGPQPPFDAGTVINSLFLQSGNTVDIQVIAPALGPDQNNGFAGLVSPGGPLFAPPGNVNIPLSIVPATTNSSFATLPAGNTGNEFSAASPGFATPVGSTILSIGGTTIDNKNCFNTSGTGVFLGMSTAPGTDGVTANCLTMAYRDLIVAPPAGTCAGPAPCPATIGFTMTATGAAGSLLAATGVSTGATTPSSTFTVFLSSATSAGPSLLYTPTPGPGSLFAVNDPANACPPASIGFSPAPACNVGVGYTAAPTVTFVGGTCSVQPVATAALSATTPGAVQLPVTLNNPGVCTVQPTGVTFSAPQVAGGTVATAAVFVSQGTIPEGFSLSAGSSLATPSVQNITVIESVTGATITAGGINYGTGAFNWLNAPVFTTLTNTVPPTVVGAGCSPASGFATTTTCNISLSLNPIFGASSLPQGTYLANFTLTATGTAATGPYTPATVLVVVTLTVGPGSQITFAPGGGISPANFIDFIGAPNTVPASITENLTLSAPPNPAVGTSISATAHATQANGPPNWLFINGGTADVALTLTAGGSTPLVITINPATLVGLTTPTIWNGNVTITAAPGGGIASLSIPVSVDIHTPPSLQFVPSSGTAAYTVGQSAAAPPTLATVLQEFGDTDTTTLTTSCLAGAPLVLTTPCPWLSVSPTTSPNGLTNVTVSVNPGVNGANIPASELVAGTITATVTATGTGAETATFAVALTINVIPNSPPTTPGIILTQVSPTPPALGGPLAPSTPQQPSFTVPAGTTTTTPLVISASLAGCPAVGFPNPGPPVSLPVTSTVGTASPAGTPAFVTPANIGPSQVSCLAVAPATLFSGWSINPAPGGTPLAPGTYTVPINFTTTGGINPPLTGSITITLVIQGTITSTPGECAVVDLGTFVIGSPAPKVPLTIGSNPTGKLISFQIVNVPSFTLPVPPNPNTACGITAGTPGTWLNVSPNSITTTDTVQVSISTGDAAVVAGATLFGNVVITTPNAGLNCLNTTPTAGPFVATINGTVDCVETITYVVRVAAQPAPINPTPSVLTFDEVKGGGGTASGANVLSQNITVTSSSVPPAGGLPAFVVASVSQVSQPAGAPATWLTVPSAPIQLQAATTIAVSLNTTDATLGTPNFPAGDYFANVTIAGCSAATVPAQPLCAAAVATQATGSVTVPVTVHVLPEPTTTVTPGNVQLNHTISFTNPANNTQTETVTITRTQFPDLVTPVYNWTAAATVNTPVGGTWLKINPAAGAVSNPTQPGQANTFVVSYDPTGLAGSAAGTTYTGTVTVTVPNTLGTTGSSVSFTVTLVVFTGPAITVTPSSATITATVNGIAVNTNLPITSTGAGFTPPAQITYTIGNVSASGNQCPPAPSTCWLSVAPVSGTTPASVTVTANPVVSTGTGTIALAAGTYSGSFTITSTNLTPAVSTTVNIIFQILAPTVIPTAQTLPFGFTLGAAASVPASQPLGLKTDIVPGIVQQGGTLGFTATSNQPWLLVNGGSNTTGTITNTSGVPPQISVTVNPAGLTAAGSPYSGAITIVIPAAPGGAPQVSNPQLTVPVILTVQPVPTLSILPGSGTFNWTAGQPDTAPHSLVFTATLSGSDTVTITSSNSWLVLACTVNGAPASCSNISAQTTTVTATVNLADPTLPTGTFNAAIKVSGTLGEQAAVAQVTFAVAPAPTITTTAIPTQTLAFGAGPVTVTTNVGLSSAPFNPTTLPVAVSIAYGPGASGWLTASPGNLTSLTATAVPFSFTLSVAGIAPGNYTASIKFATTGGINPAITATVPVNLVVQGSITTTPANGSTTPLGTFNIGGAVPSQTVSVTSNPTAQVLNVNTSATWLTVSQQVIVTPNTFIVSINPSDAAVTSLAGNGGGTLTGTVTVSGPNAGANGLNCAAASVVGTTCASVMTFTVQIQPQPTLSATPGSLTFSLVQGGGGVNPNVTTQNLSAKFSNGSGSFTATALEINNTGTVWITVPTGTLTATTTPTLVPVTINLANLPNATASYSAVITLAALPPATGTVTIPVVVNVAATPAIQVSPASVSFFHTTGVTNPSSQNTTVSISVSGTSPNGGFAFTATPASTGNWLTVNGGTAAVTGVTPGTITIGYNPAGAVQGVNNGTVTVAVPNTTNTPVTINVTLTVATTPQLVVPTPATLTGTVNGPAQTATVNVTSTEDNQTPTPAHITYTIGVPTAPWLSVSGGTTTPATLTITANTITNGTALAAGTYTGQFTLTPTNVANGTPVTTTVTFNVKSPTVIPSTSALVYSYTIGGPAAAAQTVNFHTDIPPGSSPLSFTATGTSSPAGWLLVNGGTGPVSGTMTETVSAGSTLTVSINPAGLAASGSSPYIGTITVTIPSANGTAQVTNSTISIPVNLTVHDQPRVTITPATTTFNYTTGEPNTAPASATLTVSSSGTTLDTFNIVADQPWVLLTCSVAGATVPCTGVSATTVSVVTRIDLTTAPAAASSTAHVTVTGTFGPTDTDTATIIFNRIPASALSLTANPNPLPVVTVAPGAAPLTETTNLVVNGTLFNPTSLPASVTVTAGSSWLSVASPTITVSNTPTPLVLTITPANLPAPCAPTATAPNCTFTGAVTVTTTGGINPPLSVVISVPLVIQGSLTLTTGSTDFGIYNVGTPGTKTIPVQVATNPSGVLVSLSTSATWLVVSPPQANAPFTATVALNTADAALKTPGQLSAVLTATAPANALDCAAGTIVNGQCTQTLTFTVTVVATNVLTATPASLTYNLIQGGGGTVPNVLTQNINAIFTPGTGTPTPTFTVAVAQLNGPSATWITAPAGPMPAGAVPVTINLANLPAAGGAFFATVTLSAVTPATGTVVIPVTVNVFPQPTLTVAPTSVTFNHVLSVTSPNQSQTITVTAPFAVAPPNPSYAFAATTTTPWIVLGTPTGTTPGTFTISYNLAALPAPFPPATGTAQTFNGTVTVTSATAGSSPVTIPVTLNVAAVPVLTVAPASLVITAVLGATGTATVNVTSTDAATNPSAQITYTIGTVTSAPAGWLSVTGAGTTPNSVTVSANTTGLAQNTSYDGSFTLVPTNPLLASVTVPVHFNVTSENFTVTPSSLTFSMQANGPVPGSQSLSASVPAGQAPVSFTASVSSVPTNWLTINGGTAPVSATTPATLSAGIAASAAGLAPGNYVGLVQFSSPGSASPLATIQVTLTVLPVPITVTPTSISFTTASGIAPASQAITLSSNPGEPFTVSAAVTSGPSGWLSVAPSSGTTPATLTVSAAPITVATTTTFQGLITVSSPNGPTVTIAVSDTVTAPIPCSLSVNGGVASISLGAFGTTTGGLIPLVSQTFTITPSATCTGATWTATVAPVCPANAPNGFCPSWAAITGGASSGTTVSYTAMSNPKTSPRSSIVTITGGGILAGQNQTVTITEAGDTGEPLNFRQVRALYASILGRDPDSSGFPFWTTGPGANQLGSLADSFLEAPETVGIDWATMLVYQATLNAAPSYAQYFISAAAVRTGAQTPSSLFASLVSTANPGLTVAQVFNNLLGRAPTAAESALYGTNTFAAYTGIIATSEFQSGPDVKTHTNTLYIRLLYYVALSRDPDNGGLNFWLGIANSVGNGVFYTATPAQRIANILGTGSTTGFLGFFGSPEFQFLFQ